MKRPKKVPSGFVRFCLNCRVPGMRRKNPCEQCGRPTALNHALEGQRFPRLPRGYDEFHDIPREPRRARKGSIARPFQGGRGG
jgi:hypothetical protein